MTTIRSEQILDGTIVNADISPTAAIAYGKLSLPANLDAFAALPNAAGC